MWTTEKLRQSFLKYFEEKHHKVIPSSSVVPSNDPSLLFTNSGMVQFKAMLLGEDSDLKRACSVQRCIRAGGKHNDLDDVGKDNYHHTYFEMLGNWSFGDYFKEEAIDFAWDFLVLVLGLDPERLYVTYYDELDKDSLRFWSKYLPKERILSASYEDNFWEMGETGPCGPCTEIHYDRIGGRDASSLVNKDDPDVLEIWNIVFIEFNRTPTSLTPLKKQCIDTGIGLERLLSILMGVRSNYLIDTFSNIIRFIESNCIFKYKDTDEGVDVAFRVVADHCRTIAVCLHDRVEFSNDGQGYVLRRILRRAVRYASDVLKIPKGVLSKIVKEAFVNLGLPPVSLNVVDREEELFMKTLQKGVERFNRMTKDVKELSGRDLFILYDTYGFPTDLTEILAAENNIKINYEGYEECKKEARELSKKTNIRITEIISEFPKTEDQYKYFQKSIVSELLFYVVGKEVVEYTEEYKYDHNTFIGLVFKETCFYAEAGGQIGDTGRIDFESGSFEVRDVQNISGYIVHYGLLEGKLSKTATLAYNEDLRRDTMRNHTATHILYYLLRSYIRTEQKGSLVAPSKLRFDFEGSKVSIEVLREIEKRFNEIIKKDYQVDSETLSKEEVDFSKVISMKGETYPDRVRVITVEGINAQDLCGGTHIKNTKDIRKFKIVSEGSVSANVRRIVAITGREAERVEEEVSLLRSRLESGEVVPIDKNIPLLDRLELEDIKKRNLENISKENKDLHERNKEKYLKVVSKDLVVGKDLVEDNFVEDNLVVFKYEILPTMTVKELLKNINNLIQSNSMIYFLKDGIFYFTISTSISTLNNIFNPPFHTRIKDKIIQGSVEGGEEMKDKIISLINN
ncbi:Alanine--tRNA ligase, mitochondrial [Nosema granulosis]|uniref:Alanine--tRNA ligase n=1 Tax=Nosema granulosis TaxID=83296 RepID=A0A9P6H0V8_9MICR|nr:Alanine--tRNA ligase, mitochondrial [Nosema granulosis]